MPRVLYPSTAIVFCEGRPGSLDDLLLAHLMPVGQVLVQPAGGKRGMRAYIEGYLGTYGDAQPIYVGFRDRDFDVEPPARAELIRLKGEKTIYLTYRAAVENYLIDADLIRRYWTEREDAPGWAHGPSLSTSQIENLIRESAPDIADYQAVRWALGSLRPGPRWPEVDTTWTRGSGTIPASLAYADCLAEAYQLVVSYAEMVGGVHPERMAGNAQEYRERFAEPQFLANCEYLLWFHGKDHLVRLCHHLAPSFPRRHYAAWAAENVDAGKHADLQQLVSVALAIGSHQNRGPQ